MCRLEEEWVNKLKNSKAIQDSAFDKLKEALDIEEDSEELKDSQMILVKQEESQERSFDSGSSSIMSEPDIPENENSLPKES